MTLWPGEPSAGPWRTVPLAELVRLLGVLIAAPHLRPLVVAIDGRGGAGKTTLCRRLEEAVPGSVTVHTDDIAWNHSIFGWASTLIDGVLAPAWAGDPVSFTPTAWVEHGRAGAVIVPIGTTVIWLEGTGAARRELKPFLDSAVWVQCDRAAAEQRLVDRDGAGKARDDLAEWLPQEVPFFLDQRPWESATVIIAGTPVIEYDPEAEVVIAPPAAAGPRAR